MSKRGLGRRLDELLASSQKSVSLDSVTNISRSKDTTPSALKVIAIDKIQRGSYQPRRDFNQVALQELADSIKTQGIIQPVVLRIQGDAYELIAGERRWRAAQLAGLHEIPAVVRDISDKAALAIGLIENIQREDLNPIEEAQALHRLMEEFSLSQAKVAASVGRSRSAVANLLRLLNLSPEVKMLLERGDLEVGHAKVLLALEGRQQLEAARTVVEKGLSVRETESLVKRCLKPVSPSKKVSIDPNVRSLQRELSEKLGAKVEFQNNSKGRGKMIIYYYNHDELDGILAHIH